MSIEAAFLDSELDVFTAVAAFADARELERYDVRDESESSPQAQARQAIKTAIGNALRHRASPGSRIALIKGDAGSGKSHVLTTAFKQAASLPTGEVYPAVLQLTAPVNAEDYEIWLIDALVRQLTARHFGDDHNQSPLRRMAARLLSRMPLDEQDDYLRLVDDIEDDGEISLAQRFAARIRQEAQAFLQEDPPSVGFIAAVLLAGYGDWSAVNYLQHGIIDDRIGSMGLVPVTTAHQRLEILRNLGLAAQAVGASLAIGFDQVENAVTLSNEGLFVQALTQAVRIAEASVNTSVVIASLADEYDDIVGGNRSCQPIPNSDRDRIEGEVPRSVRLRSGKPEFLGSVIAARLSVMREHAGLETDPDGAFTPLPEWLVAQARNQNSVRAALREVAGYRDCAIGYGRLPSREEYIGLPPEPSRDFDKEWADWLDTAPATRVRLLPSTMADLLVWWAHEASREQPSGDPAEVVRSQLDDAAETPLLDIVVSSRGVPLERRQLAVCEAPNRNHQLADQLEAVLAHVTHVPAVIRTNGFPRGKTSQPAPALRKVATMSGLQLDLGDTEWHTLSRAKDFADSVGNDAAFLAWRRDRQWLLQLVPPLDPLIAHPRAVAPDEKRPTEPASAQSNGTSAEDLARNDEEVESDRNERNGEKVAPPSNGPFPVYIGQSDEDEAVLWAPYREAPNHLNNFGMLVTGDAGSGKTQTIRVMIDSACQANLAVTIFDFKDDYSAPEFASPLGIDVVDVRSRGLPFNPLQPPPRGESGCQPIEHAFELASVLARVFRLGAVQQGKLRDAIAGVYRDAGIEPRDWVDPASVAWPSFDQVLARLEDESGTAAIITKLSLLVELGLFPASSNDNASFEDFINRRACLKLSDLPTDEVKAALAEIIIIQLHGYALRGDHPRRLTRMMVFDEAHRVKDSQRLESLGREGRAFGVGIVLGTQFPGDITETMAGNLASQLFLMNSMAKHQKFVAAQLVGSPSSTEGKALIEKLQALSPFEGVFANAHYSGGIFVRVHPHYARQAGPV